MKLLTVGRRFIVKLYTTPHLCESDLHALCRLQLGNWFCDAILMRQMTTTMRLLVLRLGE